jgi:GWxTD domain-containing protein
MIHVKSERLLVFFFILGWSCSAFIHAATPAQSNTESTPPSLAQEHKDWLEEVGAIISDYEKKAFMSLKTFQDRENFKKAFWEDRDPTPGTVRNEFKEEYEERFEYVKLNFNREGDIPAWKTDRGKTWMKLGKPRFRRRFPGDPVVYPTELWHYTGVHEYGLPETFYVLFFQKNGIGPYRIYSPAADGIESLVRQIGAFTNDNAGGGRKNRRDLASFTGNPMYEYLETVDPDLAFASFSLLPSEGGYLGGLTGTAHVSSEIFLGKLEDAKNYNFEKRHYVEAILRGRPHVEVYYSLQPLEALWQFYWFRAPSGDFIVDYGLQIPPDKFEMGKYDQDFYTALAVEGTIQTAKDNIIVEKVSTRHEIRMDEASFEKIRYTPFQYLARRMIVPGNYKIAILVRNEFSKTMLPVVEDVKVPDFLSATHPYFSSLMLVQSIETQEGQKKGVKPFEFGNAICYPLFDAKVSPNKDFSIFYQLLFPDKSGPLTAQDLTLEYEFVKGTESLGKQAVPFSEKFKGTDVLPESVNIIQTLKPPSVSGTVNTVVRLKKGETVLSQSEPLTLQVSPETPPVPWRWTSGIPEFGSPYNKLLLAEQYYRLNQVDRARELFEQALVRAPELSQARFALMRLNLKEKKYQKVVDLGHDLEIKEPRNRELLWLLGWGHYGLNQFPDAIRFFERARMEDPKNIELLNVLANAYCNSDNTQKCLEIMDESLKLDPDQPDLIRVKERVNGALKKPGTK